MIVQYLEPFQPNSQYGYWAGRALSPYSTVATMATVLYGPCALYRYRAPSIGERLFPINQCWEPHPGLGKGYIAPAPGSGPYIQY